MSIKYNDPCHKFIHMKNFLLRTLLFLLLSSGGFTAALAQSSLHIKSVEGSPSVSFRLPGKSDVKSCAHYVIMVGKFMDAATGSSLSNTLEFMLFANTQKKDGPVGEAISSMVESHGNAALSHFTDDELRRGFIMSSCLYNISPSDAMRFSAYFASRCTVPSRGTWGSDCFVPVAAALSKCIAAEGKSSCLKSKASGKVD